MAKPGRVEGEWAMSGIRSTKYEVTRPSMTHSVSSNVIVGKPIPPPLTVRYTWDSDDDSGIGHSRGGHGGSTSSSTETETTVHDLNCIQKQSMSNAWRWNQPVQRKCEPPIHRRTDSNEIGRSQCQNQQNVKPCINWANSGEIRPKCELTKRGMLNESNYACHEENFRVYSNMTSKGGFQPAQNHSELSPRLLMPSIHTDKQPMPPTPSVIGCNNKARGHLNGDANERSIGQSKKWDIRRVWSYSGESKYLSNTRWSNGQVVGERMARKTTVCNDITLNPAISEIARRPSFIESSTESHEKYTLHLSAGLRGNQNYNWSGERPSRAASLASLVTVDNVMIHAHACLAAVIPASEVGDTLSVIDVDVDDEQTFQSESNLSISYPQPPPPQPPWVMPSHSSNTNLYSNSHLQQPPPRTQFSQVVSGNVYGNYPPPFPVCEMASDNRHILQNNVRPLGGDCAYAAINKPAYATISRATYATVNKNLTKKDCGPAVELKRTRCGATQELEEIEPPLPPRNYRSELASKRLTTSKSSLSTRMNGLTRSAKQALRKAFSLEGLNCIADPHNETQDWDDAEDWVHIIALNKPNTPSAVKARDAMRDKSKLQCQQMATLC